MSDTQSLTRDRNAEWAGFKAAQATKPAERLASFRDKVSKGIMSERDLGASPSYPQGKLMFTYLTGPDAHESFTFDLGSLDVTANHGLDVLGNGRAALYTSGKRPAWHEMGTHVPDGLTTGSEILAACGGLYEVGKDVNTFNGFEVPSSFVTYRKDTGRPLGTVGRIYTPFQNLTAFGVLDELLDYGMVCESAGVMNGGAKFFVSARMPESLVVDPNGIADPIIMYVVIINSHDGSTPFIALRSPWRPECANTERFSRQDAEAKYAIKHTVNGLNKVAEAKRVIVSSASYYETWAAEETELLATPFNAGMVDALITDVFGVLKDDAPKATVTKDAVKRETIQALFAGESAKVGRNAYAAERAITGYVDHFAALKPRGDLKGESPLMALGNAILTESNDKPKSKAHDRLMLVARSR